MTMDDDGNQPVSLGFVNDADGATVGVLCCPDGSVLIERAADLTFIEIPAGELAMPGELIGRAAMTGQGEVPRG
jgi:hypothetical protein